jgi:hypothetical protein
MNSAYRSGYVSVILAAITSVITAFIFVGVLLCTTAARGATPGLSRTLPLVRLDGTTVGHDKVSGPLPYGRVKLEIRGSTQRVGIEAFKLTGSFDKGLAVYIGDAPDITNAVLQYVGVLSNAGTNGHWRLRMESKNNQAPPQFVGFDSLTDLVGFTFFVATDQSNAVLRANVSELVPNPAQLSYRTRVAMDVVDPTLSANSSGYVLAKYNGRTGGSVVVVGANGLNKSNRYVAGLPTGGIPVSDEECTEYGKMADNGVAIYPYDSGKGDELPYGGSDANISTVLDLVGDPVSVMDCFGGEHLSGVIPGPKK